MKPLSPRDLACVSNLCAHGLSLLEIKLSCISPWLNQPFSHIPMQGNSRLMCVVKEGRAHTDWQTLIAHPGDRLFVLSDDAQQLRATLLDAACSN
jgi:hypothetical protein